MKISEAMNRFYLYLEKERSFSSFTLVSYKDGLSFFYKWCKLNAVILITEITNKGIEEYRSYVFYYNKSTDEPLCTSTMNQRLSKVRLFCKWLTRKRLLIYNPASELELIREGRTLPRIILTENDASKILNQPKIKSFAGKRDRAILETFYSTGMRRSELMDLRLDSIDFNQGTVFIKKGKGYKDRIIPIGESARHWVQIYLQEVGLTG